MNDGWPTSVLFLKMKERPQCIHMHNDSKHEQSRIHISVLSELQIQDLSPGPYGLVAMHYHFVEFPILSQEDIYYGEKETFFFFWSFLENKTLRVV